ncbi:MAG: hypothetical protein ACXU82_21285 [Caulobacteraceae bacterium]
MRTYRAYLVNREGRIVFGEWLHATEDSEALSEAHALCTEDMPKVEIWQGTRLIAEVPCNAKA